MKATFITRLRMYLLGVVSGAAMAGVQTLFFYETKTHRRPVVCELYTTAVSGVLARKPSAVSHRCKFYRNFMLSTVCPPSKLPSTMDFDIARTSLRCISLTDM